MELTIYDGSSESELYVSLLTSLQEVNANAVSEADEEVRDKFYHPLDRYEAYDFLKNFVHKLSSKSKFLNLNETPLVNTDDRIFISVKPVCTMNEDNKYINIKDVAEAKGLTSTRSIRLELNKVESKYISREIKVNGGTSYEILFSSLEPEIQQKLREAENKTTALVPHNYKEPDFVSDKTKLTANYRANIVVSLQKLRKKYPTKKEADTTFLELYNSGLYLPKAYNFIGSISIGTLHRWVRAFEKHESTECLQPKYKWSKQGEYNSILNDEMRNILLTLLLHPSKYNYGKAIKLTKEILRKRGYEELPCDLSFKRFAENFRKNNYAEWILRREGMKAYHDKVEPYIERDISKIEVGDILVADGHVLNFQVINPFTGKPTRATLVGFLDWKSTALVGYEVMMTESTQCIASALPSLSWEFKSE